MAAKKQAKPEPEVRQEGKTRIDWTGMTRDSFAAAALNGLCASRAQHKVEMIADQAPEIVATAYIIADSMVKLRGYSTKELKEFLHTRADQRAKEQVK